MARKHPYFCLHRWIDWMRSISLWVGVHATISRLSFVYISIFGPFILTLLSFSEPENQSNQIVSPTILKWFHSHRFEIAFWLLLIGFILRSLSTFSKYLSQRRRIKALKPVLDTCESIMFEDQDSANHEYRATLFQIVHLPIFGWFLSGVARSGHKHQQIRTVFSVDRNNPNYNTGVAGECYRRRGLTFLSEAALPDPAQNQAQYLSEGYIDQAEYDIMRVKARVFFAIGVDVRDDLWGVLLLETTDTTKLPNRITKPHRRNVLKLTSIAIRQILEGL